jgi:hypothetical protein
MTDPVDSWRRRDLSILGVDGDDPRPFVFDYFNDSQIKDLAQSLDLDLALSREIKQEQARSGGWKVSAKVAEVGVGSQLSAGESAAYSGPLQTETLIAVLVRLRQQIRLHTLSHSSVDHVRVAAKAAIWESGWVIVDGLWQVGDPLSLTLIRTSEGAELLDGHLEVWIDVPANPDELTPTGRARLRPGRQITADVFAQPEQWNESGSKFTAIAHAVFARKGHWDFKWMGASLRVENPDDGY